MLEKTNQDNGQTFYTAKMDRVFKTIFCDENNKDLMKEFLSRLLEKNVEEVQFLRSELGVQNTKEKVKTVDIFALVDGEYIHIELNTGHGKALHLRNFCYFTSLFNKSVKRGKKYNTRAKFLHIDFTYGLKMSRDIKEIYHVINPSKNRLYLPNFTIIEYNMDRIKQFWYDKNKEMYEKYKHLIMLDLKTDELKKIAEGDDFVEEFEEKITHLNDDETFQSWMDIEEDRIVMFNTEKELAFEDGMEKGKEENQLEIARNMLKKGMEISLIQELTGLSIKQINTLKTEE